MQSSPNDVCGSANHGQEVTIKWAGNKPNPSGNFWIVGVNNSSGGISGGQIRWGASASGTPDSYEDTDFDSWKNNVDNDNDHYFIVRTE